MVHDAYVGTATLHYGGVADFSIRFSFWIDTLPVSQATLVHFFLRGSLVPLRKRSLGDSGST